MVLNLVRHPFLLLPEAAERHRRGCRWGGLGLTSTRPLESVRHHRKAMPPEPATVSEPTAVSAVRQFRFRRTHWSGFRQIPAGGEFERSKRVSGCNRAVKQGGSKNGERENSERTFSVSARTPMVAPDPRTAGFETENQSKCAGGRKSAWARQKRQNPEGSTRRVLR
jgi:hypothetical protein